METALELTGKAWQIRAESEGKLEDELEIFALRARVLITAEQPEEAREVVRQGCVLLDHLAANIRDEAARARFRKDVPSHRSLRYLDEELKSS